MSENKTIDGLPVRKATSSRAVPLKHSKHSTASAFTVKNPKKHITVESDDPIKLKAEKAAKAQKATSARAAHADFLKPVETFDFDLDDKALKKEQKSLKKANKKADKKTKKKPGKIRKIITFILLIIVLAILGAGIYIFVWGNDILLKITDGSCDFWCALGTLTSEEYVDLKTDANGRTNILIFGTSGYDMDGTVGNKQHDGSQLTDSIMVLSIDQYSGDVAMTSLPRDLKVPQACYAGKINEVYICQTQKGADEATAAAALEATVSEVLGIEFQYYAHINWESLIQVVDALGGVTVVLDENINDKTWTGAVYKAGVPYTLDGEAALGLARARHGTSGGDFTRGTSQQKILIGIKDRVVEKMADGSFTFVTAANLFSALGDNLRTNISVDEIKTAVHLASSLDFNSMRQVYLINYLGGTSYMKTANINNISYVVPSAGVGNYTAIKAFIAKEFSSDAVMRESAGVLVLNGTETAGLAATTATALQEDGYTIVGTDNAPAGDYPDTYAIYLMNPDAASGTAKTLKGLYNVEIQAADALPAGISAGDAAIVIILGGTQD